MNHPVTKVPVSPRPEPGSTRLQPFAPGTGGSDCFRIPALAALDDGTLAAACDARWNHSGDGAGLDTIVSISRDGGSTWEYSFPNYLGDNGNCLNDLSTCFIDPALATDGRRLYMIVDLYPAGIALNTARHMPVEGGSCLDERGCLRLRLRAEDLLSIEEPGYGEMAAAAQYKWYLDLQDLTLREYASGSPALGYRVDPWFNLTCPDGSRTNLFFADSPFQVYPSNLLYLTVSQDAGRSWSAPRLLELRKPWEQTLLIGPGNGVFHKKYGNMIFTAYPHTHGYERCSLIWEDPQGLWHRSQDATRDTWSSEGTAVILPDETVRLFYRDGGTTIRYTDYRFENGSYVPIIAEVDTGVPKTAVNQISAVLRPGKDGQKPCIFLSTACSAFRERVNGKVYTFTLEADNTLTLTAGRTVTEGHYGYSCLALLPDGDLGLLYESADAGITYRSLREEAPANS